MAKRSPKKRKRTRKREPLAGIHYTADGLDVPGRTWRARAISDAALYEYLERAGVFTPSTATLGLFTFPTKRR